jgi:hypothetical protein
MRGSPARTYETGRVGVRSPNTSLKALCCVTGTIAGIRRDTTFMPSSMRRPMFKSVVMSAFKAGLKPVCKAAFRSAFRPWAAAGVFLAVPIIAAPIIAVSTVAVPGNGLAAESLHCLTGDEQRAAIANGKTVPLATVIHSLHRAPKDVIKAQLCQEPDRLIYVLTLLGRDGKVRRAMVDATNGAVVGER